MQHHHRFLVVGTGNKVEEFGVGFFTKYGDGGVDISPIADLLKSEVVLLGQALGVIEDILHAPPTDGLWKTTGPMKARSAQHMRNWNGPWPPKPMSRRKISPNVKVKSSLFIAVLTPRTGIKWIRFRSSRCQMNGDKTK